ncbi:ketose-bisphosphate aldolase [Anaerosinus massiliensis]|uniref:ketose-bisphosphate aldolase n=1 Tax=Massilibacillus massiliensis TaxID=1806837 RepID=UPI000B12474E|nr:ketose-bisphosphate aldolase [Massilibacillus massiliensis]
MLVKMSELLSVAKTEKFAVGAFNVSDSSLLRAVTEEAEASNSPAIIAIHPDELKFITDAFMAYVIERTKSSTIPFVIHLDHGGSFADVMRAIHVGFSSVMIDGSRLPYHENVLLTKKVVEAAHAAGVCVEGELGTIGNTGTSIEGGVSEITYTDPDQAEDFVKVTGVDSLAVAIGTAHGIYPKDVTPKLQMHILQAITEKIATPIVLHGGSANPDKEIAEAVKIGVQKVNISSDMKFAFYKKAREILSAQECWEPNMIYPQCIDAAREVIRFKMNLFGSIGMANRY